MVKNKETLTKAQRRETFLWFVVGVIKASPFSTPESQMKIIREELDQLVTKDGTHID